jgi:arylsulfatase A-like enzyme
MSAFSGLYPEAHGLRNWREAQNVGASPSVPTLATLLQGVGYRTEAYTGGGNVDGELGFARGFDVYEDVTGAGPMFERASRALRKLAARSAGAPPFLLFLHTYEIHDPYAPPAEYAGRFVDPSYTGSVISSREDDVQRLRDLYDAGIALTDEHLGRFLALLDELGIEGNTIVCLMSDHGEEFFEHGGFLHETVFQEVLRVPLILRLPGGPAAAGTRVARTVRLVDLTPTLLDHLRLPVPEHMQGVSLLGAMEGETGGELPVLSQWLAPDRHALRAGDWKYLRSDGVARLFDLAADPGETRDLGERMPARLAELAAQLEQLRGESAALAKRLASGRDVELDPRTREELEALGYLGEPGE